MDNYPSGSDIILNFLKSNFYGVIATLGSSNKPEAALVNYVVTDNLEIIIQTTKLTRKYKNIMENSKVAFVVAKTEIETEVQYEGEAEELKEEDVDLKDVYFSNNPDGKRWEPTGQEVFILIKPKWIRYSDFAKQPREIFEANL